MPHIPKPRVTKQEYEAARRRKLQEPAMQEQNAQIKDTYLGNGDQTHGVFSASIHVEYAGGTVQTYGGYNLRGGFAAIFIEGVLDALELTAWEDLPGTMVRVRREDGHNGRVVAIGHIIEDRWFDAEAHAEKFRESASA